MMEESQEELTRCKDSIHIMKRKRTKRQRPQSPIRLTMVSSCSSGAESGGEGDSVVIGGLDRPIAGSHSPANSVEEFATSTKEEEDMANCLMLLAQGPHTKKLSADHQPIATTSKSVASRVYVYECKTCNRCFPSFQALGGHRASHKKPKVHNNNNEEKKGLVIMEEEDDHRFGNMNTSLSLQIANRVVNLNANNNNNNKKANKVHECSICGAEFSSGQALGGHMRRHRAFMSTNTMTTTPTTALSNYVDQAKKSPRNNLQLDLNLPAPEDHVDRRESKFSFASKERVIVFSTSSLVDCHY